MDQRRYAAVSSFSTLMPPNLASEFGEGFTWHHHYFITSAAPAQLFGRISSATQVASEQTYSVAITQEL